MSLPRVLLRAAAVAGVLAPLALSAQARAASVRLGGVGLIGTRNAAVGTTAGSANGLMGGVEFLARNRFAGLTVRTIDGTFTASSGAKEGTGQITVGDVRLILGPRIFSLEGGAGRRAFSDKIATRVFNYGTAGARITLPLGGSGYEAQLGGAAYLGGKVLNDSSNVLTGFHGQTALYYAIPRLPMYVMAGYRFERVTISSGLRVLPEEVSGVVLGMGLQKR